MDEKAMMTSILTWPCISAILIYKAGSYKMEKYGNFHKIFALACINSGYVIHGEDQVVMYIELVDYSIPLRSKKE